MKKTILAAAIAVTMLSGCSLIMGSQAKTYDELRVQGDELYAKSDEKGYVPSKIPQLELARLVVNTTFLTAKPVYERYTDELKKTPALGNFYAAVKAADSEEKKQAIYDKLSPEKKKIVDDFNQSSVGQEILSGLKDAALVALKSSSSFLVMDTKSMVSQMSFADMISEKDAVVFTGEQIAYLDATVVSAYRNSQIVSAMTNAQ